MNKQISAFITRNGKRTLITAKEIGRDFSADTKTGGNIGLVQADRKGAYNYKAAKAKVKSWFTANDETKSYYASLSDEEIDALLK